MAVALLTSPAGEDDADGDGLAEAEVLELPPGSATHPTAKIERAMTSARAVFLGVFILGVPRLQMFIEMTARLRRRFRTFVYFAPGVLAFGEADAAGEGLAAGLALATGTLVVAVCEGDAEGLAAAFGVFESLVGSAAQPAANAIGTIVRSSTVVRLMMFSFDVLISFLPRSSKIEKRDDDCSTVNWQQWVFPHNECGVLRLVCTETLVSNKGLARIANALQAAGASPPS